MASCSITVINTLAGDVSSNKREERKTEENTTGNGQLMTIFTKPGFDIRCIKFVTKCDILRNAFLDFLSIVEVDTCKDMNSSYDTHTYIKIREKIYKRKQNFHLDSPA